EDLAASVQVHAERLALAFEDHWVERTGLADVALAGGVAANVRINQKIHELPRVRRCFVHPGMSDCGMGIGAALALFYELRPGREPDTRCLDDVYLGPDWADGEIEAVLSRAGVPYSRPDDLAEEVADLLAGGSVVARFAGRMEYGPRALGNRSILYQPTDPSVNEWLNDALKRTEFMPFAPAVLEDEAHRCFVGMEGAERTARFMTITFDCTEWMREAMPGVVHLDGTARPQIVRREDNPGYYDILDAYRRRTGLPGVINTSFNLHEEPIVCSPEDALRAFREGHLDYLAIGGFLVRSDSDAAVPEGRARKRPSRPLSEALGPTGPQPASG
ncbi:MAG TPA: carbamoyltransferase C-terminal domain-containing protein, partial [Longimicrobiales bacterium]|nr:carbamoyltransferase C-terminal domain-containing protein [Longimicrobiales bacterium]